MNQSGLMSGHLEINPAECSLVARKGGMRIVSHYRVYPPRGKTHRASFLFLTN